jgi:ribosomal protein L14E/L6E/L27E
MLFELVSNAKNPKKGYIYAVTQGTYKGEFIVYIDQEKDDYCFITVPGLYILKVPVESFLNGFNSKIIEFVKKLPNKHYKVLEAQYSKLNITYGLRTTETNTKPDKRTLDTPKDS